MRRTTLRLVTSLFGLALVAGRALAHEGHETHESDPGLATALLPLTLVVASLVLGGVGIYLDRRDDVDSKYSDAGMFAGVVSILAAVGLLII